MAAKNKWTKATLVFVNEEKVNGSNRPVETRVDVKGEIAEVSAKRYEEALNRDVVLSAVLIIRAYLVDSNKGNLTQAIVDGVSYKVGNTSRVSGLRALLELGEQT